MLIDIALELGLTVPWRPWIPRVHPDGRHFSLKEFELDGNPIADAQAADGSRGIRITQIVPKMTESGWAEASLPTYDISCSPSWPRAELFITVLLSETSVIDVRGLLWVWMNPSISMRCIKKCIRCVNNKYKK